MGTFDSAIRPIVHGLWVTMGGPWERTAENLVHLLETSEFIGTRCNVHTLPNRLEAVFGEIQGQQPADLCSKPGERRTNSAQWRERDLNCLGKIKSGHHQSSNMQFMGRKCVVTNFSLTGA